MLRQGCASAKCAGSPPTQPPSPSVGEALVLADELCCRHTVVVGDDSTGQLLSWNLEESRLRKVLVAPRPVSCLAAFPGQDHVVRAISAPVQQYSRCLPCLDSLTLWCKGAGL